MDADWKRLDRHGLSYEPGQPVLMSSTVDKLDEYADRIEELEAKLAKAVEALELLHDNVVQAWPSVVHLGPVANARATLAELKGSNDE